MPKYILKRTKKKKTDKKEVSSAIRNGSKLFSTSSTNEGATNEVMTQGSNPRPGRQPLAQSGLNEFVFNGLNIKDARFPESFDVSIYESIDQFYRYGKMVVYDVNGFTEFTGITNTRDGETLEITLKNAFEGENGRVFKFGLYNMKEISRDNETPIEKRAKKITYDLFEEPFYTNYKLNNILDDYFGKTAIEMIADMLEQRIKTENIKLLNGDKDPIFPSFLNPNWLLEKTIKYLQQYCDKGPVKIFNISKEEDTITVITPLSKLIAGKVYPYEFDMVPSLSNALKGAYRLGPYTIFGSNNLLRTNTLSGETILSFSYFYGKKQPKDLNDFPQKDKEKYKWDLGEEEYKSSNRSQASLLAGSLKEGIKIIGDDLLGKEFPYKIKTTTNPRQDFNIEVDAKPLVEAKLFNRFYKSFVNGGIMLHTILPGSKELNVGQIFNIELPSAQQESKLSSGGNKNELLSGKWILWKLIHRIKPSKFGDGKVIYEMDCYFLRTGFELSNRK